jgi:FlaA1/EpsC-like NDP-sugar epimerase
LLYGGEIPPWLTRPFLPPGLIIMGSVLALIGFVLVRYRSRLITGLATRWMGWREVVPAAQERVLIIGCGEAGRFAAWMLEQGRYATTFHVVGFVDDDIQKQDTRIQGAQVLGRRAQIPDLVQRYDIGIIVYAIHNISPVERRQLLEICSGTPARVVLFPDISATLDGPVNQAEASLDRLQLDSWLAQLEETASTGDLQKLKNQIRELRGQVRGEDPIRAPRSPASEEKPV